MRLHESSLGWLLVVAGIFLLALDARLRLLVALVLVAVVLARAVLCFTRHSNHVTHALE
jgi:hypothetical protein